jgi:hypothetical protein
MAAHEDTVRRSRRLRLRRRVLVAQADNEEAHGVTEASRTTKSSTLEACGEALKAYRAEHGWRQWPDVGGGVGHGRALAAGDREEWVTRETLYLCVMTLVRWIMGRLYESSVGDVFGCYTSVFRPHFKIWGFYWR